MQKQVFNVILMDVTMPGLSGVDTFKQIKLISPESRVIMMSAYSIDGMKKCALEEGAIAFFKKPLDTAKFFYILEK